MADRKRYCCNCERNIRHEVSSHGIECYCEIDGHHIGYIECFEGWCRRWKKDHTFDVMEEPKVKLCPNREERMEEEEK